MASVVLQSVTKQFGPKVVLQDVSLEVRTGETVGLVGANGTGKTTLFKLITGEIEPDYGTVTSTRGLEVGLLPQEPQLATDRTLHEEVGRAFDELLTIERKMLHLAERMSHEHDSEALPQLMTEYDRLNARFDAGGGYQFQARLNEILGGLGFRQSDHHLPVAALSGGQKCRAALGKLLLQNRQLLLLDEPTNHLDLDATRWLERFLAGHHGGAVIISHDRYLLDRLVTKIIEVEDRRVRGYPGSYSTFVQAKETRLLTQQRQAQKDREFIEKEQSFIEKHIGRQRGKEAKGRRKRLERRMAAGEFVIDNPRRQKKTAFRFGVEAPRSHGAVVWAENLSKSYGDKLLFEHLHLEVWPGERVGITGPNGTGKSTLLRIIMGEVEPTAGDVTLAPTLSVAYYDQEHTGLDRRRQVLDEVREARPDLGESELRSFLGRFLFSGEDVFKPIGALSGGEQSRVRLAKLVLTEPQVLILDEPTNHLDIPSREALEEALDEYVGTLVVVSHDRYFLDRVIGRILVLERGTCSSYAGNYSFYQQQLDQQRAAGERERKQADTRRSAQSARPPGQGRQQSESTPFDGLSLEQIEQTILAREEELERIQDSFGNESTYRDPSAPVALQNRLSELQEELTVLNRVWEERVDTAGG